MTDDIDDEFRDIVSSQLADLDDVSVEETPPLPELPPAPPPPTVRYELTSPRSWTPPPEDDTFVPPPPLPPARSPSTVAWVGIVGIVVGVVILGGVIIGQISSSWGTAVGFIAVCSGILVLFTRLPKDRRTDDDNGARL